MAKVFWNYSDTLFPLMVLMVLLIGRRRVEGRPLLLAYLVATVALMGFSNYLADRRINNMVLYHIYSLVEVGLLLPLLKQYSGRAWLPYGLAGAGFLIFWLVNLIAWEPPQQFNSNSASLAALVIAGFSFLYYVMLVRNDQVLYFQKLHSFWIVSGLLFYSIASILVLGSYKYKSWFTDIDTHITWKIQQVANMIKFVLFTIGLLCNQKQNSRAGLLSSVPPR
jgi:hypothetical protein